MSWRRRRNKNIRELLDETKNEVLNLNEKFIQYSILKRDVDSNRVLYDSLESSIKTEGVTEQSQSVNIWVVRKASLPEAPSLSEEAAQSFARADPGAVWRHRHGLSDRVSRQHGQV